MNRLLVGILFATLSHIPVQAQSEWTSWLDSNATGFSGVVLIGRGDEIQAIAAYGVTDRESNRANTLETRFNLGSINKTFTALAIAQLAQQGRLAFDDTVATHIPDYPNSAAAAKITIRQLLTHRSGVATFMRLDFGSASLTEMTKTIGAAPQAFEPGARQEYSNGGYVVLGRIVEIVSGQSYDDYVSNHIYKPAGMTQTGFLKAGERDTSVALGYFSVDAQGRPVPGGQTGMFGFSPPARGNPAGGGYSTAQDLFKFARALRTGRLLKEPLSVGFGLREQVAGGRRLVGNGGGAPGVNAEFRFEPTGDYTVVVLANSSPPAATRMLESILGRLGSDQNHGKVVKAIAATASDALNAAIKHFGRLKRNEG